MSERERRREGEGKRGERRGGCCGASFVRPLSRDLYWPVARRLDERAGQVRCSMPPFGFFPSESK